MRISHSVALLGLTTSVVLAAESPVAYRSGFDNYRRWQPDLASADWVKTNQQMAGLGGHAGHIKPVAVDQAGNPVPAQATPAMSMPQHGMQHEAKKP